MEVMKDMLKYHERVADISTLPALQRAVLAKALPVQYPLTLRFKGTVRYVQSIFRKRLTVHVDSACNFQREASGLKDRIYVFCLTDECGGLCVEKYQIVPREFIYDASHD